MRIAYIVQCHKNAEQINWLSNELVANGSDVYIHLDKKAQNLRQEIVTNMNINIIPLSDSVDVRWGTFSQCEATFLLIKAVLASGIRYDYVCLLSGQDVPLRNQKEIEGFLSVNAGNSWIEIMGENSPLCQRFDKRNAVRHFECMMGRGLTSKVLCRLWYTISGGTEKTFKVFRRVSPFNKLYYGSSWWCLPFECIKEIVDLYDNDQCIKKYFEGSANSDESIFQTLFMHTSFKGSQKGNQTYTDWSANLTGPKILTIADEEILMANKMDKCFARKFDLDVDRNIIEKLYKKHHKIS